MIRFSNLYILIGVAFIFFTNRSYCQLKDTSWVSSAGGDHFIRLKSGKVYFSESYGDAGDNRMINFSIIPVGGLKDIQMVSAGMHHSLALDQNGRVWAWGENNYGQLGIGSVLYKAVPIMVNGVSDIVSISAGMSHSLALKKDGSVWAWGNNREGQIGLDSGSNNSVTPVQVIGLKNVKAVACGYNHSLALKEDGTVWAWGYNGSGQMGNNSNVSSAKPTRVEWLTDVKSISASVFNMALRTDGTVWAWGYNLYGQLGNGNLVSSSIPVQVKGLSDVKEIYCGFSHALAVTNDNVIFGWGSNQHGQLNDSTKDVFLQPVELFYNSNGYKIVAGAFYSMAYSEYSRDIKSWGNVFYTIDNNVVRRDQYLKNKLETIDLKIAGQ